MVVGSWNNNEHVEWAKKNVARSYQLREEGGQKVKWVVQVFVRGGVLHVCCLSSFPLAFRLVSHFYGHGDVCDLTGKPRQVIVKLK